ncbi:uncharacterized protein MYCFIDRAFT_213660 [Pseudocercospora fijiensis CIRAD86]|uniref:Uncharacterized protein n=1 Tax=Pseudocercospora fijiensis (strain CIRAD86) TaxID=383855 RepID=N1QCX0_PSEFD|nr:uncharacterized protein MYCFIDRAFT_213660 [Pseudocercospora fijiensis CIRAD86]EME89423.1 hypothetical protein MYCFIDRAFT_213660 [Pseudocercospora fijiensis CIRAD86]
MSTTTTEDGDEQVFFDAEAITSQNLAGAGIDMGFNGFGLEDASDRTSVRNASKSPPTVVEVEGKLEGAATPSASCRKRRKSVRSRYNSVQEEEYNIHPVPPIPPRFLGVAGRDPPKLRADITQQQARPASSPSTHTRIHQIEAPEGKSAPNTRNTASTTAAGEKAPKRKPKHLQLRDPTQFPAGHLVHYELTRTPVANASTPLLELRKSARSCPASPTRPDRSIAALTKAPRSRTPPTASSKMYRAPPNNFDKTDLFMELGAEDNHSQHRPITEGLRRSMSRASNTNKRMSLPANLATDSRPSTSGNIYTRPASRLENLRAAMDVARYAEPRRLSNARAAPEKFEENASIASRSQYGRARGYSALQDRPPSRILERVMSPASQASTQFGRRRNTSFDTALSRQSDENNLVFNDTLESHDSSPPASSDPQRTDSSVESQTADTVWDELDELKNRIKKLEGGKTPPTSSAAASGESNERPRTATTAPTTIASSPKHVRKPEADSETLQQTPNPPSENTIGGSTAANVHPLLQDALARAKNLLSSPVYRTLEATVHESMQLAAATGAAGSQGSNPTSVSINDRHVRRKADNICRNLTDLCIALCDSKQEPSTVVSSPAAVSGPAARAIPLSSLRNTRSTSLAVTTRPATRPQSRLEVRRSSLFASLSPHTPRGDFESISPRTTNVDDYSASEADFTPTHPNTLPARRLSAVPQDTLRSRQNPDYSSAEESRSFRAPSRAMTDLGSLRAKSRLLSEDRSPGAQRRSPSLRECLAAKRSNDSSFEGSRVGTLSSRRKLLFEKTPPVVEEEVTAPELQQRRPYSKAFAADIPSRRSSLKQHRRQVAVE